MVVRTFEAEEIVRLPRMTTADTMALATALLTRAETFATLPAPIAREHGRLRQSLDALRGGTETRVQEQTHSDAREVANRFLDAAWGSARWWCKGWTLLPYPEYQSEVASARKLETMLFPDGLRFTQLPFRDQWVQSQARLGLIEKESLASMFAALGGQAILDAVRRAHDEFGRVLGFTNPTVAAPSTVLIGESRDDLKAAMRRYVLQVTAHADPDDPQSQLLADTLLMPIKLWKTRAPAPVDTGDTDESAPPAEPPSADKPSTLPV
jgi:hypothetical protein